jgi:hypothetical protein
LQPECRPQPISALSGTGPAPGGGRGRPRMPGASQGAHYALPGCRPSEQSGSADASSTPSPSCAGERLARSARPIRRSRPRLQLGRRGKAGRDAALAARLGGRRTRRSVQIGASSKPPRAWLLDAHASRGPALANGLWAQGQAELALGALRAKGAIAGLSLVPGSSTRQARNRRHRGSDSRPHSAQAARTTIDWRLSVSTNGSSRTGFARAIGQRAYWTYPAGLA